MRYSWNQHRKKIQPGDMNDMVLDHAKRKLKTGGGGGND